MSGGGVPPPPPPRRSGQSSRRARQCPLSRGPERQYPSRGCRSSARPGSGTACNAKQGPALI
eukprot:13172359-Alexandrium_andersonii.AAC.1